MKMNNIVPGINYETKYIVEEEDTEKGRLEALITAGPAAETAQQQIEEICAMFVNELHRQGITKNNETFLEAQKNEILAKLQRA